jgi:FtsP/CotA-like multicopper oxidase with cupredoxin domain
MKMDRRKFLLFLGLALLVAAVLPDVRQACAALDPGGVPHYFGPYPNYANSPLPTTAVTATPTTVGNPLAARGYPTDLASAVLVVNTQAVPQAGTLVDFRTYNQPGSAGFSFHAYVLRPTGTPNEYQVVFDSGPLTVPPLPAGSTGQVETFPVSPVPVQGGDVIAHYGQGIPIDIGTGPDILSYPAPAAPVADGTIALGTDPNFPLFAQARIYSIAATVNVGGASTTGGIRKFVDGLPGLGPTGANNLGQYIPVAASDTTTYPGSDYYEIAVVQYEEQMHTDLPPTRLRGYVQLSTSAVPGGQVPLFNTDGTPILLPDGTQALAVDNPHYLGPAIAAQRNRPVRILFRNLLPTGVGGDLFIPVDVTVMGSGKGPTMGEMMEMDPQRPMCGDTPKPMDCFTENRATLHLHGGISPWISDGTPHQWTTPANEDTPYPKGVSVQNVPDMPDPGPGAITFFYTNQQSARLMFYHDHAWGITRLNVYAGEAAAYLITDPTEESLVGQGIIPADQIPLVIQDKTFVPDAAQLEAQDPTWDISRWGGLGSLWMPHVYMPAQNPGDASGVNQFGRWAYGPWFWPPTASIDHGPIPNPYYDPACNPDLTWCEPPLIPGVPYVSMGMEAFQDTPVVNGTAYPAITVEPKSYRLRILNAANDRFWNLSLYKADASGTEVELNAAEVQAALLDPAGVFPTPVPGIEGPSWIQIGTEGGFLPSPVVIPPQPTTWVTDPTVFNAGNVDKHSLLLGPAERADVIVDFSAFAGQTLILYNDAPAAFPARDPRYDYYTGNADLTSTGGAPSTLPGYGPNIRTVMQIRVADAPAAPPYDLAALQTAFKSTGNGGQGVFESSQNPIIVGQSAYNDAYGTAFNVNGPNAGLVQIFDTQFSFKTLLGTAAGPSLTFPLQPKQIQDEMGEAFEREYGRMSGYLGLEKPGAVAGIQNMILYPFVNPASEIIDGIELPMGTIDAAPIAASDDGTQVWKITHNGVDTHPIHFHLFDVQLINRVGWDGIIRRPDQNELGWKDTVRISPLEDTIVALRPIIPKIPFGLLDSERPLNPMMPLGSPVGFNSTDAFGDPIVPPILNRIENFGWEYVWHCHILSHEEMDMMRPISVLVDRTLPAAPVLGATGDPGTPVALSWTDGTPVNYVDLATWGNSANEVGFRIERATGPGAFEVIATALANVTSYTDTTTDAAGVYQYRVVAFNAAGDSRSNSVMVGTMALPPAAPTGLAATLSAGPQVRLDWTDNAGDETGFVVERSADGGAFVQIATPGPLAGTGGVSYVDGAVAAGGTYSYRVYAVNGSGPSGTSNTVVVNVPAAPLAPTNLTATVLGSTTLGPRVRLNFRDNALNETGFMVERSVNGGAFSLLVTLGPRVDRGGVTYMDGVQAATTYSYRVYALNGPSPSGASNTVTVTVPSAPAAPSNFNGTARVTRATARIDLAWTDNSNNETRFVIQRATDAAFTAGLVTITRTANVTALSQTRLPRKAAYYYRIMAQNPYGQSAWVNAAPFPIVTP